MSRYDKSYQKLPRAGVILGTSVTFSCWETPGMIDCRIRNSDSICSFSLEQLSAETSGPKWVGRKRFGLTSASRFSASLGSSRRRRRWTATLLSASFTMNVIPTPKVFRRIGGSSAGPKNWCENSILRWCWVSDPGPATTEFFLAVFSSPMCEVSRPLPPLSLSLSLSFSGPAHLWLPGTHGIWIFSRSALTFGISLSLSLSPLLFRSRTHKHALCRSLYPESNVSHTHSFFLSLLFFCSPFGLL